MRSIASPAITARSAFAPITTITSSQFVYLHADHLDTPRFATDALQRVVWRWRSDAFVIGTAETDPDSDSITTEVNLRFPGQYSDPGTGLHYNYFRDYDPSTGRYVQSDPIGLQGGANTFVYVNSAPMTYIDPYGLAFRAPGTYGYGWVENHGAEVGGYIVDHPNNTAEGYPGPPHRAAC